MRGATEIFLNIQIDMSISIHAPHAGCDKGFSFCGSMTMQFQSTHPMRGATVTLCAMLFITQFQSTHPMRGATIHAEPGRADVEFQSTHPMRGATLR